MTEESEDRIDPYIDGDRPIFPGTPINSEKLEVLNADGSRLAFAKNLGFQHSVYVCHACESEFKVNMTQLESLRLLVTPYSSDSYSTAEEMVLCNPCTEVFKNLVRERAKRREE